MDTPITQSVDLQSQGLNLGLSKYSEALIKTFILGTPKPPPANIPKLIVSQTVSFAAFLYEKMRNAIEYREEHLIRRAAIERILKRRLVLNANGKGIADNLIKELLWARYMENNSVPEEMIPTVQGIIDKYFYLRNEITGGRPEKEKTGLTLFIMELLSAEIEERLAPNPRREAFTNYVYQVLRPKVAFWEKPEEEKDIQVYIAVERSFAKSDPPLIRYHLFRLLLPDFINMTWQDVDRILPKFYDIYKAIEKEFYHPLGEQLRRFVKKNLAPFLILRDLFEANPNNISEILHDDAKLKFKTDEICRKKYQETGAKLRRAGVRSFIYIVLTKIIFAVAIEVPVDIYLTGRIAYLPVAVNLFFPALVMAAIVSLVGVPGQDNTKRIYEHLKTILVEDPDDPVASHDKLVLGRTARQTSAFLTVGFSLVYALAFVFSFGTIFYILSSLGFNLASQTVFIFFLTLVTFFGYRIRQISTEYQVMDKEGALSPLGDFFLLPILGVGKWLSGEISRLNLFIFIFDFIIEAPFKALFEVLEEWFHFVRVKKEEMV